MHWEFNEEFLSWMLACPPNCKTWRFFLFQLKRVKLFLVVINKTNQRAITNADICSEVSVGSGERFSTCTKRYPGNALPFSGVDVLRRLNVNSL